MTMQIPFVPHPRLDYTLMYNAVQDDYRYYLLEQQKKVAENQNIRLENFHEDQRMKEKQELKKELEDVQMYAALAKRKGYYDYKYAYWVGTLVDQYIQVTKVLVS